MSLREEAQRGHEARREYEELETAFATVRAATLEAIVRCHPSEQRKLDRLISTAQVLDAVKHTLLQTAAGVELAEAMLDINPEL